MPYQFAMIGKLRQRFIDELVLWQLSIWQLLFLFVWSISPWLIISIFPQSGIWALIPMLLFIPFTYMGGILVAMLFGSDTAFIPGAVATNFILAYLGLVSWRWRQAHSHSYETAITSIFLSKRDTLWVFLYSLIFLGTTIPHIALVCIFAVFPFTAGALRSGDAAVSLLNTNAAYMPAAWLAVFLQAYLVASIIKFSKRLLQKPEVPRDAL